MSLFFTSMSIVAVALVGEPAAVTNAVSAAPELGSSLLRVLGALVFVVGIFLGGVWVFRRWQQAAALRAPGPRLTVIDSRSLGARQSLLVVGYQEQRFLIGASPAGLTLLSCLPEGNPQEAVAATRGRFVDALQDVLHRKAS